ncbi:MAG: four helix bundle protein, partial [Patescibacteria group bacterium]|nr:four helix bundle protein [Patescibacteria group bacterium]
ALNTLPIIDRLIGTYKLWHEIVQHLPKTSRFTLGAKIDSTFVEVIELIFTAGNLPKDKKLPYVQKAVSRFDLLKFFLQIAWLIKSLDNKKYLAISEPLNEIGKMLGGWHRNLLKETSPELNREKK